MQKEKKKKSFACKLYFKAIFNCTAAFKSQIQSIILYLFSVFSSKHLTENTVVKCAQAKNKVWIFDKCSAWICLCTWAMDATRIPAVQVETSPNNHLSHHRSDSYLCKTYAHKSFASANWTHLFNKQDKNYAISSTLKRQQQTVSQHAQTHII